MSDLKSRFSFVLSPQALPGNCAGCGKATDSKGFIDTGFEADFHGVIYFCSECVLDMASNFGLVLPEVMDKLKGQISELELESANQRKAILGLEEVVEGLLAVRDSGVSNIVVPTQSEPIIESQVEEITPEPEYQDFGNPVSESSESDVTDGNSKTDEFTIKQESIGIPSDTGVEFADLNF